MIAWMKFSPELMNKIYWLQQPLTKGDCRGGERRCYFLDLLLYSLQNDCTLPTVKEISTRLHISEKTTALICTLATEHGQLRPLPGGGFSTDWLIKEGFVCDPNYNASEKPKRQQTANKERNTAKTRPVKEQPRNPFLNNIMNSYSNGENQ